MLRAALLSPSDLAADLGETALFRSNVDRLSAATVEDVRRAAGEGRLDVVVVDSALPDAPGVVSLLRQDPITRPTAIVALGRAEFSVDYLDLLEAGANAILPLPPGHDWDDRLMRLIHVPVRRATRFPVDLAIEGGLRSGLALSGRAVNLSVHGMLIECAQPLEVGEDVRLSLRMPAGYGGVRGTGTVVRLAAERRFGVELTHLEEDGRVRIKRFVEAGDAGVGDPD